MANEVDPPEITYRIHEVSLEDAENLVDMEDPLVQRFLNKDTD